MNIKQPICNKKEKIGKVAAGTKKEKTALEAKTKPAKERFTKRQAKQIITLYDKLLRELGVSDSDNKKHSDYIYHTWEKLSKLRNQFHSLEIMTDK